jgi:hypothetical protein
MASIRVDMDRMTSGSKHGSIRQPNTIINTDPNIVLIPPIVQNYPPTNHQDFTLFKSELEHEQYFLLYL